MTTKGRIKDLQDQVDVWVAETQGNPKCPYCKGTRKYRGFTECPYCFDLK